MFHASGTHCVNGDVDVKGNVDRASTIQGDRKEATALVEGGITALEASPSPVIEATNESGAAFTTVRTKRPSFKTATLTIEAFSRAALHVPATEP